MTNKSFLAGTIIVGGSILVALLAPYISPYNPFLANFNEIFEHPSLVHLLGTDQLGRDLLSRIIYGARPSILVSVASVFIAVSLGLITGTFAGYYEGIIDPVIMRMMDILLAFPPLILALLIITVLGSGLTNLILAISISMTPLFSRIARGSALTVKNSLFVEAAIAGGEKKRSIILRYILPNSISPLIVQGALAFGFAILYESGLSYLGVGVQPPTPDWGLMINNANYYLSNDPYLVIFPGVAVLVIVIGFNLLGEGLRQRLDIRTR